MTDCLFCKIIAGEIPSQTVHEDDLCVAFKDIHPKAPTHLLIVPREHIPKLDDADSRHKDLLGHMTLVAAELARKGGIAENGYRLIVNNGPHSGQEVYHIHFHLLGGRPLGPMVVAG